MRENIEKLKRDVAMRKLSNEVDMALLPLLFEEEIKVTDAARGLLKSLSQNRLFLFEKIKDLKGYLMESWDFMKNKLQNEAKQVKDYEDELSHLETFVTNLADEHVDL